MPVRSIQPLTPDTLTRHQSPAQERISPITSGSSLATTSADEAGRPTGLGASISADDPAFPALGYWRGFVWGPMAQLTFWAFREYAHVPEVAAAQASERQGRAIDHDPAASMERKKREGYF